MTPPPLVYVTIPTFNNYEDTRRALTSLQALTYPNFRIVVVDNGSTDETVARLPAEFPEVRLHCNSHNLGFAAGINVGLRVALDAGAEFVLVLNNDVVVEPRLLEPLIAAVNDDVGVVAPLIYALEEPGRVWSSGFRRHPLLLEMRGGLRGKLDAGQWQGPAEVDYLLGCALLLPARTLSEVGLFDEQYFFYYEDLDLSMRIQAQGYRLLMVPEAHVWHKGAATAGAGSPFHVYHMARGSAIFFHKYARGVLGALVLLYRLGSSLKKSLSFIVNGRWDLLGQHWRGVQDGWRVSCGT